MKKLLFILLATMSLFISCTSNEKKAQQLITDRLKESLHDWDSYESVKFGTLDSTFTTVFDDSIYYKDFITYTAYKQLAQEKLKEVKLYDDMYSSWAISKQKLLLDLAQNYIDSAKYYEPICEEREANFIPQFNGWKMQHSYRANNAGGHKSIGHYIYFLDKELTKVIGSEDVSKEPNHD